MAATWAFPLRYLIAVEDQLAGHAGEIIEVGYNGPKPKNGLAIRYGNLLDQTDTSAYGPYLGVPLGSTADQYGEKIVNPLGTGWHRLLDDQCKAAKAAGFSCIEWDNPDAYSQSAVLDAVDFAAGYSLGVVAKNPLVCNWDCGPYVKHPAIVGIIVEEDEAATPAAYEELRKEVGRLDLPVWFVAFKAHGEDGKSWAAQVGKEAVKYINMWVSYSPDGEYTSSVDVAMPVIKPPDPPAPPSPAPGPDPGVSNFEHCCDLLLVHEGGNDDDPHDPGGRTSRGIIQREYDVWRQGHPGLPSDVWQAPQRTVENIYEQNYWNAMRCNSLPPGIDYCVFDYGVNSGNSRGIKQLQSSLHVPVDGVIGPVTLAAAAAADPNTLIDSMCDGRLQFLRGLSTWRYFGRGWTNRVNDVRRDAHAMAENTPASPGPPPPPLEVYDTAWIQRALNKLGAGLVEDGRIGPLTRAAMKAFQSAHGLVPGAIAGPMTIATLKAALAALPPLIEPPKPLPDDGQKHDLGARIKRTMLAKYPQAWFPDQNVVSVEGMNPDGTPNANRPNAFDDIKMVLDGDGKIIGGPWEGTTQPGVFWTVHPMASGGAFIIALGPQACWSPGDYHGPAWRQAEGSTIWGTRDPNATYKRQGPPVEHGNIGVHHHKGYDLNRDNIANAAAGCQVIRLNDEHNNEFMPLTLRCPRYLADKKNYRLTATVLEAKDILP